MNIHDSC